VDIISILIITLITIPVVEFTEGVPRIILGVIVLLLFPGYTLVAALFPAKRNLRGIERAGLTLILSFALVSLTGLALNYTTWGIRLNPLVISITALILICSIVAVIRRMRLPEEDRFRLGFSFQVPRWTAWTPFDRVLSIALAVVVIGSLGTLAYVIERPKAQEDFTNFYMLGPNGMMENYPSSITLNEQADITLGIENHENKVSRYTVKVVFDGQEVQTIGPLTLADEQKWSNKISLKPSRAGDNQKVEFYLYKNEETAPYLNLRLWLDVK
jgi:uncharacterized membrane protein